MKEPSLSRLDISVLLVVILLVVNGTIDFEGLFGFKIPSQFSFDNLKNILVDHNQQPHTTMAALKIGDKFPEGVVFS